ncbi:His-Xaa-Ser repeat protein HxsA2 [Paraburkholderia sp. BCC1884]|uniref:His-Xaa-Ser repeat protein HxsA2 n=1 Tax=Paraburkholderia sp. BCC1884 TaxID=2562668 RepID=UPI0011844A2F|nr:His-Xaa-Ser repeat protein HxsA2 [Paraburkholderia sp. BCC1884]
MKAKFLVPVSTLAAAMAAQHSDAAVVTPTMNAEHHVTHAKTDGLDSGKASQDLNVKAGGEAFKFVLKRSEAGQLMAYHSSHASHSSHSSHSSSSY